MSPVASFKELHLFHISEVVKKGTHVKLLTDCTEGMKQYDDGKRPVSFFFYCS